MKIGYEMDDELRFGKVLNKYLENGEIGDGVWQTLGNRSAKLENWAEEGWAWVEEICKMLECGEGQEYEIRERINALKLAQLH